MRELRCASCGEVAIRWFRGRCDWAKEDGVVYEGIVVRRQHELEHLDPVLTLPLSRLDRYVQETLGIFEGMDGYCPECARVYCRRHYVMETEFDEGFYDCTYGTCPAGHRRMIDD